MSRRKDGSFVPRECKLVSVAWSGWIFTNERLQNNRTPHDVVAIQSELVHDNLEGVGAPHASTAEKSVRMASKPRKRLLNGHARPRKTDRVEGAQRRSLERAWSR